LGISGNDSNGVVKRFDAEVAARRHHIIIFEIGINDCKYLEDKGDVNISIEKHRDNMTSLVTKAKGLAEQVIVVGITPVEEEKVNPTPWNTNKSYKNSRIEEYNEVLQDICRQEKIDFVDVYSDFMKQSDYKDLLHDGLHPNSAGHERIFSLVNDLVKKYI
jgi:lysophospholipase L1-like esterase